jgi:pyruvate/2-oxoglutarate dehydrogenase complex dihydrolipoamide dehydrogenase (E3) component
VPPIEGLEQSGYLTNETVFHLTELPRRLAVIGAGPMGCELGQAFCRFGAEVHLIDQNMQILGKEDPDAAGVIQRQFELEGIRLVLGARVARVEVEGNETTLVVEQAGGSQRITADAILVAPGRRPNTEGLGLEAAGVEYDERGIRVDDHLRTTNRRIYAAGDICTRHQFTHAADAMARLCIQNALFGIVKKRISSLVIPRVTYTDPEVASVGLSPREAAEQGIEIDTYREDLVHVDRAILDGETAGFAKVHCRKGTGRVVGATLVSSHAGESIGEITLLMTARKPLGTLASTIHSYPTQVEVLKRIADQFQRGKLTPAVASIIKIWLRWQREGG